MKRRGPPGAGRTGSRALRPGAVSCLAAEVRVDNRRLRDHRLRRPFRDDPSRVHADEASDDLHEEVDDVLDPEHGYAPVAQAGYGLHQRGGLGVGETSADLVEEQHGRIDRQRAGQLQALALKQAESLRTPVGEWRPRGLAQYVKAQSVRLRAAAAPARRRPDTYLFEHRHSAQ